MRKQKAAELPPVKKLITLKDICDITGMTDKWFYQLIKDGKFPEAIKLGRSSRWIADEVAHWLNERILDSRPDIDKAYLYTEDDVYAAVEHSI